MLISAIKYRCTKIRFQAVCVAALLAGTGLASANDQNNFVPADTHFYVGTDRAIPVAEFFALMPVSGFPNSEDNKFLERMSEFGDNPEEYFVEWGIDTNVQFSMYTVGLAPVIRIALKDAKQFQAELSEFEKKHSLNPEIREHSNQSVRIYSKASVKAKDDAVSSESDSSENSVADGDTAKGDVSVAPSVVVAVGEKDVVFGVLLPVQEGALDALIGAARPETSIVQSGKLKKIRKQWKYGDEAAAFVDIKKIAETVVGSTDSAAAGQLESLLSSDRSAAGVLAMLRSEPCSTEITQLAESMPLMVSGNRYFKVSDDTVEFDSHFAAVLKNELLLETLQLFRGVVPLSQSPGQPLFSVGLGLTVDRLAQALGQISQLLSSVNYQCNALLAVNQLATTDLSGANMGVVMFGGLARGVRGLSVNVFDLDLDPEGAAGPIKSVDTAVAVSADDPGMLLQTLRMMPQFGALADLPLDGTALSLNELLPIPLPAGVELQAAVKAKNIVIYSGEKGTDFANRLGGNDLEQFLHSSVDLGVIINKATSFMDVMGIDADEEVLDIIGSYPKGVLSYSMDFTDQGVELVSTGKYEVEEK
ncbi:hypothetical protein AB833_19085 [Chromatiales bacterium (ex Bugula neritina AB1)]|nr:hypothetical protein AB833_19085 [Chromatiales bacterium (ex Bugula neritina AB1)]